MKHKSEQSQKRKLWTEWSVLESACHEDSKTYLDIWIWEMFEVEDKAQFPKSWSKVEEKSIFEMVSIVFKFKYFSKNFIKINL